MDVYFNELMTVPCKILRKTIINGDDGVFRETLQIIENTVCHYHSIKINLLEQADKENIQGAFIVCIPKESQVCINDLIQIENNNYKVINIRKANIRFETICECVI